MTRAEAIQEIRSTYSAWKQELCCSTEERTITDQEMRDAFNALGVTDEEIDAP